MIHKDLVHQLEGLVSYFPGIDTEDHPLHEKYVELETFLIELSKHPKKDWNEISG